MSYAIMIFGGLIAVLGLVLVAIPARVLAYAEKFADRKSLYFVAIAFRLLLGVLLVAYAANSRFPLILAILGWLTIAGALFVVVIGRARLGRLIRWGIGHARPWALPAGILAVFLGGFLIYAVI